MEKTIIGKEWRGFICDLTCSAALACAQHIGLGDRNEADQAAVNAMRSAFQKLSIKGRIVIGEGERDQAPMLYIGEKVGVWGENQPEWDIAVDPLEGTNLCAKALDGAISVLAISERDSLFNAPDIYMEKIACGPLAKEVIDINKSVKYNVQAVGSVLNKKTSEIMVAVLNRPRHENLIQSIYALGARVCLLEDGDLAASILTSWKEEGSPGIDLMMGVGGAPEGVLSASALKCLGGGFQGRLVFQNEGEKKRALSMGIKQIDKVYDRDEIVKKSVVFCATGVTNSPLLKGVQKKHNHMETESLYMCYGTKEHSKIRSIHSTS